MARTAWKAAAGAAERFRDFDAHEAELEQPGQQSVDNSRVLVHVAHVRPDLAVGKLIDAVAKQPFVRRQRAECFREWSPLVGHGLGC